MMTRVGGHEYRSKMFRANALIPFHFKHAQTLCTTFWGSTLYASSNRMWKFLENRCPRLRIYLVAKWLLLSHKVNAAKIPF